MVHTTTLSSTVHGAGFCPHMVEIFFIDTSPLLSQYWTNQSSEPLNFTGMPDRAHAINYVLNVRLAPCRAAVTHAVTCCGMCCDAV